jgi:hypothetical protein
VRPGKIKEISATVPARLQIELNPLDKLGTTCGGIGEAAV